MADDDDMSIDEIESAYRKELRELAPELRAWKKAIADVQGLDVVEKRWPTGLSGHPRFIRLFREYYAEIENLNLGGDVRHVHFKVLVDDVMQSDPDLRDVLEGLVFVPVGMDQDGDAV